MAFFFFWRLAGSVSGCVWEKDGMDEEEVDRSRSEVYEPVSGLVLSPQF